MIYSNWTKRVGHDLEKILLFKIGTESREKWYVAMLYGETGTSICRSTMLSQTTAHKWPVAQLRILSKTGVLFMKIRFGSIECDLCMTKAIQQDTMKPCGYICMNIYLIRLISYC